MYTVQCTLIPQSIEQKPITTFNVEKIYNFTKLKMKFVQFEMSNNLCILCNIKGGEITRFFRDLNKNMASLSV